MKRENENQVEKLEKINDLSVLNLIDELQDKLENSTTGLFGKRTMSNDEIIEYLTNIKLNLPDDIKIAQRIIENKNEFAIEQMEHLENVKQKLDNDIILIKEKEEKIIEQAHKEAEMIINTAHRDAEELVSEHQIILKARRVANTILKEAKDRSLQVLYGTVDYTNDLIDEILQNMKLQQQNTLKNKEELNVYLQEIINKYENAFMKNETQDK